MNDWNPGNQMSHLPQIFPLGLRGKIKISILVGLLFVFFPIKAVAGDGSTIQGLTPSENSAKINIFADEFIARLWPELPESYRIMAFLSASLMVEEDHQTRMNRPSAPLLGISLTIEW
jgi:hypothetical protein